jgi:hypothetical protein
MLGEELNSSYVTARGLLGDRAYALVDEETGKVASAKNPRKCLAPILLIGISNKVSPSIRSHPLILNQKKKYVNNDSTTTVI